MGPTLVKVLTGLGLLASGGLLHAASWQRWAGVCPWGGSENPPCLERQDHLYDFLPPVEPWEPVGSSATLGGIALLLLATTLLPLAWSLTPDVSRRSAAGPLVVAAAGALCVASVGAASLRSSRVGEAVAPALSGLTDPGWMLAPVVLCGWLAVLARGWARAAAVLLLIGTPLVAYFSYSTGPFDAAPWWEAAMGTWIAGAGLCLVVAAARGGVGRQVEASSEPMAAM